MLKSRLVEITDVFSAAVKDFGVFQCGLIHFAWSLNCLSEDVNEHISKLNRLSIYYFLVCIKHSAENLDDIDLIGFPASFFIHLAVQDVLEVDIVVLAEKLEESQYDSYGVKGSRYRHCFSNSVFIWDVFSDLDIIHDHPLLLLDF